MKDFIERIILKPFSMFKNACARAPIYMDVEDKKYYTLRCPLVDIYLLSVEIDHINFNSRSLNLRTPNAVKTPKLQIVTSHF